MCHTGRFITLITLQSNYFGQRISSLRNFWFPYFIAFNIINVIKEIKRFFLSRLKQLQRSLFQNNTAPPYSSSSSSNNFALLTKDPCSWLLTILSCILHYYTNITHSKCQLNTNQKHSFFGCRLSFWRKKQAKKESFCLIFLPFFIRWRWVWWECVGWFIVRCWTIVVLCIHLLWNCWNGILTVQLCKRNFTMKLALLYNLIWFQALDAFKWRMNE